MCLDFLKDFIQRSEVHIGGKKTEDFLVFQIISFRILNIFREYGLFQFTLILKTLKKYHWAETVFL